MKIGLFVFDLDRHFEGGPLAMECAVEAVLILIVIISSLIWKKHHLFSTYVVL